MDYAMGSYTVNVDGTYNTKLGVLHNVSALAKKLRGSAHISAVHNRVKQMEFSGTSYAIDKDKNLYRLESGRCYLSNVIDGRLVSDDLLNVLVAAI